MPHYYFHVRRGQMTVLDHEGIVLADAAHAKAEAAQRAQVIVNRGSNERGVNERGIHERGVRQP